MPFYERDDVGTGEHLRVLAQKSHHFVFGKYYVIHGKGIKNIKVSSQGDD